MRFFKQFKKINLFKETMSDTEELSDYVFESGDETETESESESETEEEIKRERQWVLINKEEIRIMRNERSKLWRSNNPDKVKAYNRKFYINNLGKKIKCKRRWDLLHKDQLLDYGRRRTVCENCGRNISRSNKSKHLKTKRCKLGYSLEIK